MFLLRFIIIKKFQNLLRNFKSAGIIVLNCNYPLSISFCETRPAALGGSVVLGFYPSFIPVTMIFSNIVLMLPGEFLFKGNRCNWA